MIGIVFDGGGVKGSYQVGAYLALKKCGIKPDVITGTSIGALNGAFCVAKKEKLLKSLWLNIEFSKVFGLNEKNYNLALQNSIKSKMVGEIKILKDIIKSKGIDTLGIKRIIDKFIDEDEIRNSNIDFGLTTLNINKLIPKDIFISEIPAGKLKEYLLASAYLPVFKPSKIIDNNNYFDGGIYNTCPVNMCIDAGCDLIYVIRVKGIGYNKKIKKNNSKIVFIQTKNNLGSIIFTNHERCKYNMALGYYDALKIVKHLDGECYYFKNCKEETYNRYVNSVSSKTLKKVQKVFKVKSNKKLVLRSFEYIMEKEKMPLFKIYSPFSLLIKLQLISNKEDIVYKFIKEMQIL